MVMKTKQRFILRRSRGTPFEYLPCLSLRHSKLKSLRFCYLTLRCVLLKGEKDKSPSFPLFLRGKRNNFPLWKRGARGDFYSFKSPSFPLFLRGMKKNFPSLKKRGQGRFYSFKSPFFPLFLRFILRRSRGTPFEYPLCLSLRHSKLCLYNLVILPCDVYY